MGYVRQRKFRSKAELRLLRFKLKKRRMDPLPRKKDIEKLLQQSERELQRNARRLGVED